jgi:hypothetical protein
VIENELVPTGPEPELYEQNSETRVNLNSEGLAKEKTVYPGLSAERTAREEREQFKRREFPGYSGK